MRISVSKFFVAVCSSFLSVTASASYLTYTGSVMFSNPTPAASGASVSTVGSDAFFQTTDIGNDGMYNSIEFDHRNSTFANNTSGSGTTIIIANDFVTPFEAGVQQSVGFDFAIALNFTEYADFAKTILTGTGTSTITGHVNSTLGDFGASTTATYSVPSQQFTTATSTYSLANFTFVAGDADNSGTLSAKLQSVPEPTGIAALGMAAAAGLLARRRRVC